MAKIYDCFPFFNELDLLEIRLNELSDVVDQFVLVEATKTHQKKDKPLYFAENKKRFEKFLPRITHIVVDKYPTFFTRFRTPRTWDFESNQTNGVSQALVNCAPDDVIILSDVDEIPRKEKILEFKDKPGLKVFQQKFYSYFMDCHLVDYDEPIPWSEAGYRPWNGSVMLHYKDFKSFVKHRTSRNDGETPKTLIADGGWHYSWLGGVDRIIQKIEAYTHVEHNTDELKNPARIKEMILAGQDIFGRKSKSRFVNIHQDAPAYVQKNIDKYKNLILNP